MTTVTRYWTAELVLAGVKEPYASERSGTFPRFMVMCDGERYEANTWKALDKVLGHIYATAPNVFVNAGKGITIDFDAK